MSYPLKIEELLSHFDEWSKSKGIHDECRIVTNLFLVEHIPNAIGTLIHLLSSDQTKAILSGWKQNSESARILHQISSKLAGDEILIRYTKFPVL